MGMDILAEKENVPADKFTGHGGLFKVQGVAQQFLADALNADVSVMKTAGEGGAWGMALLAAYMQCADGKTLPEWLESCVFGSMERATLLPNPAGVKSASPNISAASKTDLRLRMQPAADFESFFQRKCNFLQFELF